MFIRPRAYVVFTFAWSLVLFGTWGFRETAELGRTVVALGHYLRKSLGVVIRRARLNFGFEN